MTDFEPSPKSPDINNLLSAMAGKDREATIKAGLCMTCDKGLRCQTCGKTADKCEVEPPFGSPSYHAFMPFSDHLSLQEYTISGMCQTCQDEVFES